ncbi:MAG: hypothetical protein J0H64_05485 [Actinobacteria bacterium]|nr:hypothetical protein [Actinomycetota bacterium]
MNTKNRVSRAIAAATIVALASGGLLVAAAPAQAAPIFDALTVQHYGWVDTYGPCGGSAGVSDIPADLTIPENGSRHTQVAVSKDRVNNGDAQDTLSSAAAISGTASAISAGGVPTSVRLDFSGTVKAFAGKAPSACYMNANAKLKFNFSFTITRPMWATLSYAKGGLAYAEAFIFNNADGNDYEDLYGRAWKSSGSTTTLLPPGEYGGYLIAWDYQENIRTTLKKAGSGTVKISFAPAGSAVSGPSGKAQSYAALGKTRSCSTHALPAKLTTSSKKIKRIKKITFSVNGKTVKTLRGKAVKRGKAVTLRLGDGSPASVKTTVRLSNGKTLTAKANYRACS